MLKLLRMIFKSSEQNEDEGVNGKSETPEVNDEYVKSSKERAEDKDGAEDSGKYLQSCKISR